eukprot:9767909-Ditylum_brightwellii.AAC.1
MGTTLTTPLLLLTPDNITTKPLLALKLYYMSDSGVDNGIGYFGWLIATETTILIECNGHTIGKESLMESSRAETYGAIVIFLFLHYMQIYKNTYSHPNK